jgi:energy-coupling factor transporter ATP-binding protein EcfA2
LKTTQKNKTKLYPLSKLVTVPPKSYPSTNIEYDNIITLNNYLPSASTLEVIDRFLTGLSGNTKNGRMLSITGPYGSGKSTMAVFLNGLISNKDSTDYKTAYTILKNESSNIAKTFHNTREKLHIHEKGVIRCVSTARREPITATILRALDNGAIKYFGKKYTKKHFSQASSLHQSVLALRNNKIPSTKQIIDIIVDLCEIAPTVIMIDEFGKNIEYFTTDETQQSDLFLLQELAEMSGTTRKIPLSIITLQHMAFEEYAIGASSTQKQEWAKIQGRFEDIPYANSPDQTRLLISNTIKLNKNNTYRRIVKNWAKTEIKRAQGIGIGNGFDSDLISSCYPLGPLSLEILPELCSRYGQYERTLLSFISDAGRYTVASFIDQNSWNESTMSLPTMGIDALYDYFISGTNMIHSISANISRLMEIETIIRDSHGLDDLETKTLKAIGILNLIGRSGYLRASQRIIDYAIGTSSKQILKKLENKSIITYRKYADEYRIWHGTDIDIATKMDVYRKRYQKSSLNTILENVMNLEPVVAAKHNIETGTMRLFERCFLTDNQKIELDHNYDGIIIYKTDDNNTEPLCDKPIITVSPNDTSDLKRAAIEVIILRDILNDDKDIMDDWVAKRELEERLAESEIILDRTFEDTYGNNVNAKWSYIKNDKPHKQSGTPSHIVSKVCSEVYEQTPQIHNEMINRTILSSQGAAARRKLLGDMITHTNKPCFGIEGYGPDRATYEAIFIKNNIHVPDTKLQWILKNPTNNTITPVWESIFNMIKSGKERTPINKIYRMCELPPFGMKNGVAPIFLTTIMLLNKNNIALYEHGTYVPTISPEVIERMIKNPDHYEVKYFKSTPSKRHLLETITSDLKIKSDHNSILDIVGYLVRTVSSLPPYVKKTKRLDKKTITIRDTVLDAIEPDTLLFDSLPKALGFRSFNSKVSQSDMTHFSKILVKSTKILQNEFNKTLSDIKELLFTATGINNREKLSNSASVMLQSVSDQKMKVFLNAIASDMLEHDDDWIKYVALSLTDIPPADWKDEQREMFENNLTDISSKFKRLASIHFPNISDNFIKPSYQVTITDANGHEQRSIVSLKPEQKKKMEEIAKKTMQDLKKKGFKNKDIGSLIAILSSESNR